jgi:DNA polymerase I-like protein with 3'-5' exonuclease and polymerase domains
MQNEARNFPIQSTASDLTLISAMTAEKPLKDINVDIINLVHDSILLEMTNDKALIKEAVRITEEIMCRVPVEKIQSIVPFAVDTKIGSMWGKLEEVTL